MNEIHVEIWLKNSSNPLIYKGQGNTYEKGSFYCIYLKDENKVYKYPIKDIFRIIENYN